jgi:chromosomal replication initiator protein
VDPAVEKNRVEVGKLVMDAQQLWTECAETLRSQVSEATWMTWFEAIRPVAVTNRTLVLGVPNNVVRERLEGRYHGLLADALSDIVGVDVPLRFVVYQEESEEEATLVGEAAVLAPIHPLERRAPEGSASEARRVDGSRRPDELLNTKYSFEAFVVGPSNRFAHAAAVAVAEMPGRSYNPLFIYGDSGLGKTHLLQGIGNYVCENFPSRHVRYVSTEMFMNEFVEAIRNRDREMAGFKRRYRECDVLLVDDVQFMEGKEHFQEEFFHTFNALHQSGKQVVLSSDRPPKSIATIEDRLRSRFLSGLITEVQPPELETRIAILRTKAEHERVVVDDDVLEFIASNVTDNIRELEGALIRVAACAALDRRTATRELAESVLEDIVASRLPRRITAQEILRATEVMFGFPIEDLCGPSRRRPLVIARQISMYVFRELTDFSYPAIAREFGGRDHTTVIHAVDKIGRLMKERRQIYQQVTELILSIKNSG